MLQMLLMDEQPCSALAGVLADILRLWPFKDHLKQDSQSDNWGGCKRATRVDATRVDGTRRSTHQVKAQNFHARRDESSAGFTKSLGTGPVWPVTGQTGPARFRFGPVSNRPKFKIQIWIQKMKNSQKISKNTSRCDESNGVKFSQKFVHLV